MRRRSVAICGVVGLLLAGAVVSTAGPATAAGPHWSVVSGGSSRSVVDLLDVSCVSTASCQAVGRNGSNTSTSHTFGESWNGHVWSVVPSRGPAGSELSGVSCVSAVWCLAVGFSGGDSAALTETWNGHGWSVVRSPAAGTLSDVSCVSRTFCIAVGGRLLHSSVEMWNGHAWVIVPSPNPAKVTFDFFDAVSCVSRQACKAVGQYERPDADGVPTLGQFIESWNGKVWSLAKIPQSVTDDVRLDDVSCPSVTSCVAVGLNDSGAGGVVASTLVERWNGTVWSVQSSPNRGEFNELSSISCVSAAFCQAVGTDGTRQLIESWNGRTWSIVANPSRQPVDSGLIAVECVSVTSCKGVGSAQLIASYG